MFSAKSANFSMSHLSNPRSLRAVRYDSPKFVTKPHIRPSLSVQALSTLSK